MLTILGCGEGPAWLIDILRGYQDAAVDLGLSIEGMVTWNGFSPDSGAATARSATFQKESNSKKKINWFFDELQFCPRGRHIAGLTHSFWCSLVHRNNSIAAHEREFAAAHGIPKWPFVSSKKSLKKIGGGFFFDKSSNIGLILKKKMLFWSRIHRGTQVEDLLRIASLDSDRTTYVVALGQGARRRLRKPSASKIGKSSASFGKNGSLFFWSSFGAHGHASNSFLDISRGDDAINAKTQALHPRNQMDSLNHKPRTLNLMSLARKPFP